MADNHRKMTSKYSKLKWNHEPQANGLTANFFRRQCSTLIFLDTRHWASEFKKSLSPRGQATGPRRIEVVQNLQVNFVACTRPVFKSFMTLYRVQTEISRSVTKLEFEFAYHYCSSFLLTWLKTSRPLIARLFLFMLCVVLW